MTKRATFLPFALPDIDETELFEIKDALESGWITTGPKVKQFEKEFGEAVGAKHAVAVNSCTAAMHLALEAIGVQKGDEVITTPYTFAATAEVIRYFDAKPVFVDVDAESLNINVEMVKAAITSRTRAVIPVHVAGYPVRINELLDVCKPEGVAVIEDAAHAFPSEVGGASVGGLGSDATCFSFYATKTITTGEGGMITTNDDAIAERCRIMALHGISKDAWKRYTAEGSWYYEIVAPGYKYNMTDIAAAMGLAQLRKAERMFQRRQAIATRYNQAFAEIPYLQPPAVSNGHAWHLYMLRLNIAADRAQWTEDSGQKRHDRPPSSVPGPLLSIDRTRFIEELKARNIGSSVHFIPLHIHPYYRELYGYAPEDFPVAYAEYMREVSLPIYSKMSDGDVEDVIAAVRDVAGNHAGN